jgi:hypothetical protein
MALAAFFLAGIGLVSLYSSSLHAADFTNFYKQAAFLAIGFFLMLVMSFFDWRIFRENSALILFLYAISVLALAGLYFLGRSIAACALGMTWGLPHWIRSNC